MIAMTTLDAGVSPFEMQLSARHADLRAPVGSVHVGYDVREDAAAVRLVGHLRGRSAQVR